MNKNDVYIGASKAAMSIFKISLHASGIWTLAATSQSGATLQNGNRRAKKWNRPLQHIAGITRGPSIFVPRTSVGSRRLRRNQQNRSVLWYAGPAEGETVEFSIYFVENGAPTAWDPREVILGECESANTDHVVLLASKGPSQKDFVSTVENILRENVAGVEDPMGVWEPTLLWITESRDTHRVPIVVDLPLPVRRKNGQGFSG